MEEQMKEILQAEEIEKEFKVFRDPTFEEFVRIFGCQYNPDLPLFVQLYLAKEMLQFYQLQQNQIFLGLTAFTVSSNLLYYFLCKRLLLKSKAKFLSFPRILVAFFLG